jgi:uracil-DNA glycosylase family 4
MQHVVRSASYMRKRRRSPVSKVVPPSGDPRSRIWLIGEAPGQTEIVRGEPFVGNAGQTLRRFLLQVGIDPTECYFDNIYNQRAPDDKLQRLFRKGYPNPAVEASISRLNASIERHRPHVVVALGAIPLAVLTGLPPWNDNYGTFSPLQDYRGSIYEHKEIADQKVIGTFHPSYINRQGYADHGIFMADLARVKRESSFPGVRRPEKELILAPMGKDLIAVKERLLDERSTITVDIEYTGRLHCIGFTNSAEWAAAIATQSETEMQVCRDIILSGAPLNMQNAMFDCSILEWHYQIPAINHIGYDTMLAAHAISPELPKDLGFLNSIYTDQPQYKDMVQWDLIAKGQQSLETLYEYNAIDVWTQHEIMERQLEEDFADRPDLYEVFLFELALLRPLWEISKRGMLVDQKALRAYKETLERDLELERLVLTALNGGAPVNVKSGTQVADMLFNHLRLRPGGKTPKGKYKVDDKTLASLLGRAETPQQKGAINYIRAARNKRDLFSKFLDVELDSDGRTRGMYNPAGTVTGRLASTKFYPTNKGHQQQNIPRKGRFVIIADPGYTFGGVDYERAESLCVAHLTNDPIMLEHHEPGADAHTLLATLFFERDFDDITKDQRFIMKQTRHAGNYMEGPITFMRSVNKEAHKTGVSVSTKEAKEFIEWYRTIHHGLRPWWGAIKDQLYKEKELTTMLGRSRTFYDRPDSVLPKAVAFIPQGTVGDLMNLGLLNLSGIVTPQAKRLLPYWEEIPSIGEELRRLDFQLLNQVHDSVGFQFPPKNETRVLELIHKCLHIPLQNPHTFETFYIGQEVKLGKSWGDAA